MLLTPLLPNAGPTGGDGEACPAPTMSLTITSLASAFLDIVADTMGVIDWDYSRMGRLWRVRDPSPVVEGQHLRAKIFDAFPASGVYRSFHLFIAPPVVHQWSTTTQTGCYIRDRSSHPAR